MTNETGPWGPRTPEIPRRRRLRPSGARVGLWLCLAAAAAGLLAALAHAFPEAVRTKQDWTWVAYRLGLVVLIGAGALRVGSLRREHLGHAVVWALIISALALAFAYREELAGVPVHMRLAFNDGVPVLTGDHELIVPQNEQGGFLLIGKVNGQRVRFLVDTGSSDTVLSPDDARRIGLDVDHLRYVRLAETANGSGYGAPWSANSLEVGPIALHGYEVVVNQTPLSTSLLGQSFLNRLESFEVRDHKLILKWRDGLTP
jgi:aspartyl protease family protein